MGCAMLGVVILNVCDVECVILIVCDVECVVYVRCRVCDLCGMLSV